MLLGWSVSLCLQLDLVTMGVLHAFRQAARYLITVMRLGADPWHSAQRWTLNWLVLMAVQCGCELRTRYLYRKTLRSDVQASDTPTQPSATEASSAAKSHGPPTEAAASSGKATAVPPSPAEEAAAAHVAGGNTAAATAKAADTQAVHVETHVPRTADGTATVTAQPQPPQPPAAVISAATAREAAPEAPGVTRLRRHSRQALVQALMSRVRPAVVWHVSYARHANIARFPVSLVASPTVKHTAHVHMQIVLTSRSCLLPTSLLEPVG